MDSSSREGRHRDLSSSAGADLGGSSNCCESTMSTWLRIVSDRQVLHFSPAVGAVAVDAMPDRRLRSVAPLVLTLLRRLILACRIGIFVSVSPIAGHGADVTIDLPADCLTSPRSGQKCRMGNKCFKLRGKPSRPALQGRIDSRVTMIPGI